MVLGNCNQSNLCEIVYRRLPIASGRRRMVWYSKRKHSTHTNEPLWKNPKVSILCGGYRWLLNRWTMAGKLHPIFWFRIIQHEEWYSVPHYCHPGFSRFQVWLRRITTRIYAPGFMYLYQCLDCCGGSVALGTCTRTPDSTICFIHEIGQESSHCYLLVLQFWHPPSFLLQAMIFRLGLPIIHSLRLEWFVASQLRIVGMMPRKDSSSRDNEVEK
jgi:hypothetical protein